MLNPTPRQIVLDNAAKIGTLTAEVTIALVNLSVALETAMNMPETDKDTKAEWQLQLYRVDQIIGRGEYR